MLSAYSPEAFACHRAAQRAAIPGRLANFALSPRPGRQGVRLPAGGLSRIAGFSMLELLVVVVIAAFLAALVAPRLTSFRGSPAPRLVEFFQNERAAALRSATPTQLWLSGQEVHSTASGGKMELTEGEQLNVTIPDAGEYQDGRLLTIIGADGTFTAASMLLTSGDLRFEIRVDPFAAKVRYRQAD